MSMRISGRICFRVFRPIALSSEVEGGLAGIASFPLSSARLVERNRDLVSRGE